MLTILLTNRGRRQEKKEDYARQDALADKADKKLNAIHILVNSGYDRAMQAELDATKRELVSLLEIVGLKKSAGQEPTIEALAVIDATKNKISELIAAMADRHEQSKKMQ
jgi:hypothetical protein